MGAGQKRWAGARRARVRVGDREAHGENVPARRPPPSHQEARRVLKRAPLASSADLDLDVSALVLDLARPDAVALHSWAGDGTGVPVGT